LLALACGHDAPRDNPLDPQLTPPVELRVALDDTAGTATLTWSRYEGEADFGAYWVLRNEVESTRVETLMRVSGQALTVYTDTTLTPHTAYLYRVSVVNAEGFEQPSQEQRIDGYATRAVRLLQTQPAAQSGSINLTWTRYGDPGFTSYRVHRRDLDANLDSVLAIIANVNDTTFADTTPLHGVGYLYSVVVAAAGQELPSNSASDQLRLPGVTVAKAKFTSATASCSLAWTQYAGPRFEAYSVQRRTTGMEWQQVHRTTDAAATRYEDRGLLGNTEYSYRVTVVTTQGEPLPSEEASGGIHELLESWPLDLEDDAYVRLYNEGGDALTVLTATRTSVRLLFVDEHGAVLEDQTLVDLPRADIEPRSVTTAVMAGARRLLSLRSGGDAAVLEFDLVGDPVTREYPLFVEDFAAPLGEMGVTGGYVSLSSLAGSTKDFVVSFDNIGLWVEGEKVLDEGFDTGADESWSPMGLTIEDGWGHGTRGTLGRILYDNTWRNARLELDLHLREGTVVRLGTTSVGGRLLRPSSSYELTVGDTSRISLYWRGVPAAGNLTGAVLRQQLPFQPVWGVRYHVGLELAGGRFRAWLATPQVWETAPDDDSGWCSIVAMEGALGIVAGTQLWTIDAADSTRRQHDLPYVAGEIRSWDSPVSTGAATWLGYCLPTRNQVVYGRSGVSVRGVIGWPDASFGETLGGSAGGEPGEFLFPISFDVGLDRRVYVLDAGNGRIQAFSQSGEYVTQWGSEGNGEGEFNFGDGPWAGSFAGSICVDDEGFIYVADVGNKRIQVFAP